MKYRVTKWNALLVLSLAAIAALFAPPIEAGEQLRVEIRESFEVHGQIFDAGTVTLRRVGAFNPTADFHEVWVDGTCLGVMIARKADAEGVAADHSMIFLRNDDNRLVLVGLTRRGEPAMSLHHVGDSFASRNLPPTDRPVDEGPLVATASN